MSERNVLNGVCYVLRVALRCFSRYVQRPHADFLMWARRVEVYRETVALVATLPPPPASVKLLRAKAAVAPLNAGVSVEDADVLDVARRFATATNPVRPLVLNLANDWYPGGDVERGAGAQEESLFRRTDLCATLHAVGGPSGRQRLYPIAPGECILSRSISVLREPEARGYAVLPPAARFLVDVLSVPGERCDPGTTALSPEQTARLTERVHLIVDVIERGRYDVAVLGALGCGAWHCPPRHVAAVFRDVFAERKPKAHIVFACLDTRRDEAAYGVVRNHTLEQARESNADVFRDVLCSGAPAA